MGLQTVTTRIKTIDQTFVSARLADFMDSRAKDIALIEAEPGKLAQTRHAILAGNCECIGFYRYALGYDLKLVNDAFLEAARAYLTVFQLRGTEAPFPVTVLTIDPEKSPGDPAFVIGDRPLHPLGSKDFSTTNSKTGLEAVFLALTAHDPKLASELAALIWDPPNASYIGSTSEVCTPNEQCIAYSVKHLLENNCEGAMAEISKLRMAKQEGWVSGVTKMTEGIVTGDALLFLEGLHEQLSWHSKEAGKQSNSWRPEFYLSLYGLGMVMIALRKDVIGLEDLPSSNVHLPLDLIVNE